MAKKAKKKCSKRGCRNDAASHRAKFCKDCFKANASRSVADYFREISDYIEEHGRPPRNSSVLLGTYEYKLRQKVDYQVKQGRFSEEERQKLAQLLGSGGRWRSQTPQALMRELRAFVAEHNKAPRWSPANIGTSEYRLRARIQRMIKKGRFSEEEQSAVSQLLGQPRTSSNASNLLSHGLRIEQ